MTAVVEITSGIVRDLPEHVYHSQPALSSTGARLLLDSPARFHHAQNHPQPHKDAYDLGTAVHSRVLGTGTIAVAYPAEHLTPSGAVSTKQATVEWVAEQRALGQILLTATQLEQVNGMSESVLAQPQARALFEQSGIAEASVFATDPATGVKMRARFDYLPDFTVTDPWSVDLKTTGKSAAPHEFLKTVANFGYHIQQEWYLDTYKMQTGLIDLRMKFVVVETAAPYLVAVHELSDQFAEIGSSAGARARALYADCVKADSWPGYPTTGDPLQPPMWAIYAEEEFA